MYDRMRSEVSKQMSKLIEFKPQPVPPPKLVATAAMKKGALKALDDITKLFGPGGKHWNQGKYYSIYDGVESFCLSGAMNKIDGKHEALARVAIHLAIDELFGEALRSELGVNGDEGAYKSYLRVEDDNIIVSFNDGIASEWSDVKKVLRQARKLLTAK